MSDAGEIHQAVIAILEDRARARATISYGELSAMVPGLPSRGQKTTNVLNDVSEWSWREHRVLLSVLVVNAKSELPSEGFFELMARHRPMDVQTAPDVSARRERERVYNVYPSSPQVTS